MSDLPTRKKLLLATFALCSLVVPIIFGAAAQDNTGPIPLVRIAPEYPPEALTAGREGHVVLEFTITANGTTRDVVVVESSAPEFVAPSVEALQKWRYAAQPDDRAGVHTVIRYQLQREPQTDAQPANQ